MVVFVRKLKVVHKQVGDCLISYHLQLACLKKLRPNFSKPKLILFLDTKFSEPSKMAKVLKEEKFRKSIESFESVEMSISEDHCRGPNILPIRAKIGLRNQFWPKENIFFPSIVGKRSFSRKEFCARLKTYLY